MPALDGKVRARATGDTDRFHIQMDDNDSDDTECPPARFGDARIRKKYSGLGEGFPDRCRRGE